MVVGPVHRHRRWHVRRSFRRNLPRNRCAPVTVFVALHAVGAHDTRVMIMPEKFHSGQICGLCARRRRGEKRSSPPRRTRARGTTTRPNPMQRAVFSQYSLCARGRIYVLLNKRMHARCVTCHRTTIDILKAVLVGMVNDRDHAAKGRRSGAAN